MIGSIRRSLTPDQGLTCPKYQNKRFPFPAPQRCGKQAPCMESSAKGRVGTSSTKHIFGVNAASRDEEDEAGGLHVREADREPGDTEAFGEPGGHRGIFLVPRTGDSLRSPTALGSFSGAEAHRSAHGRGCGGGGSSSCSDPILPGFCPAAVTAAPGSRKAGGGRGAARGSPARSPAGKPPPHRGDAERLPAGMPPSSRDAAAGAAGGGAGGTAPLRQRQRQRGGAGARAGGAAAPLGSGRRGRAAAAGAPPAPRSRTPGPRAEPAAAAAASGSAGSAAALRCSALGAAAPERPCPRGG